jgi:hypothetical protein
VLLGTSSAISKPFITNNLDWLLIDIDDNCVTSMEERLNHQWIGSIVREVSARTKILALTASNGSLSGFISANSTYMQLPNSSVFQEMWTVQLDGPLRKLSITPLSPSL